MKKFLYSLLALTSIALVSCEDDTYNVKSDDPDMIEGKEHMALFLTDNNTGTSDYLKSSHVDEEIANKIWLSWTQIDGCAGYHIRICNSQSVLGHPERWMEDTYLYLDTIVGPNVTELVREHLEYSQVYYFSIRTLSERARRADGSIDLDSPYHSKWFGHGSTSDWANYFGMTTNDRYDVPDVLSFSDKTETTMRVTFDSNVATAGAGDPTLWQEHFEMEDGKFVFDQIHVMVSTANPTATFEDPNFTYDPSIKRYVHVLTDAEKEQGYIDLTGLTKNSAYVINAYNSNQDVYVDAVYNTISPRTTGEPGEPILLEWKEEFIAADTIPEAREFKCVRIDTILDNFMRDTELAEGTIFELEGGKTYYLFNSLQISKGFTLRTKKEDADNGLRARIYMKGIDREETNSSAFGCNFVFGKRKESGEADAPIFVDDVILQDLDFDVPLARNYNDQEAGYGENTGNYIANMYSDGLAVTFNSFQIRNCTFQGFIRGFIRVQGSKRKTFEKLLIENCVLWNCGNYGNKGNGYPLIASDGKPVSGTSNVFKNCIIRNNTLLDSPSSAFVYEKENRPWPSSVVWNVDFSNNTIINYNTITATSMFDMRYIPTGSKFKITNNLFMMAKDLDDERVMNFKGSQFNDVNSEPNEVFFEVHSNYSCNWDPNKQGDDQVFTASPFSATSNSVGKFKEHKFNGGPAGSAFHPDNDLVVRVGSYPLLPTELMSKVNPPHHQSKDQEANRMKHRREVLDLYYNNDAKVTGHEIYQKNIGDYRWKMAPREEWTKASGMPAAFHAIGHSAY